MYTGGRRPGEVNVMVIGCFIGAMLGVFLPEGLGPTQEGCFEVCGRIAAGETALAGTLSMMASMEGWRAC